MIRKVGVVFGGILFALATVLLIRTLAASNQDFIYWTEQDSGTLADLNDVIWGGGQYLTVGENGKVATSPDGIIWTNRPSGTSRDLTGVAWSGTTFVAVGGDTIISSHDGSTWTPRVDLPIPEQLYDVAWGNGIFVAVGWVGGIDNGLTMISGDGVFWTKYPYQIKVPNRIDWAGGHFYLSFDDYITRSSDALAWEAVVSDSNSDFQGVCEGNGLFVAVGDEVTCVSSNGSTWVCTDDYSLTAQKDVVFSNGRFLSVGDNAYISTNGVSWTHSLDGSLNAIADSGFEVVAVGTNGQLFSGDTSSLFFDSFESGDTTAWSKVVPTPAPPTPTPTPTDTPTPTNTPTGPTPTPTPLPLVCAEMSLTNALQRGIDGNPGQVGTINMDVGNYTPYAGYLTQTTINWADTEAQASNPFIDAIEFEGNCNGQYWKNDIFTDPALIVPPYSAGGSDCSDANVSIDPGDTRADWFAYLNSGEAWVGEVCVQLDFYFPDDPAQQTCIVTDCLTLQMDTPTPTPTPTPP